MNEQDAVPAEAVRAWMEWDEWSGYVEDEGPEAFWSYAMPKGGHNRCSIRAHREFMDTLIGLPYGLLRSIRVLLRTGHEVEIDRWLAQCRWWLFPPGRQDGKRTHGYLRAGDFDWIGISDAEAVARALQAAAEWLEAQDG